MMFITKGTCRDKTREYKMKGDDDGDLIRAEERTLSLDSELRDAQRELTKLRTELEIATGEVD